jgi:hypothetical protein
LATRPASEVVTRIRRHRVGPPARAPPRCRRGRGSPVEDRPRHRIGAGDPEHVTVQAIRAMNRADVCS